MSVLDLILGQKSDIKSYERFTIAVDSAHHQKTQRKRSGMNKADCPPARAMQSVMMQME
jgi:hypothetical protein